MALVASIERKIIARRLLAGRRERSKRDGLGSGFCPFGYTKTAGGVAIVPDQAAIIRRLFSLHGDGATYATTAQALNDDGVTTPTGRPWTTATIHGIEHETRHCTPQASDHGTTLQPRRVASHPVTAIPDPAPQQTTLCKGATCHFYK